MYFDRPLENVEEVIQELDTTTGVVEHGLSSGWENANVTCLIVSAKGVQLIGKDATPTWWKDLPMKRPLERESVDNRMPINLLAHMSSPESFGSH